MTPGAEIELGPHWWKASALTTRPTLPPVIWLKLNNFPSDLQKSLKNQQQKSAKPKSNRWLWTVEFLDELLRSSTFRRWNAWIAGNHQCLKSSKHSQIVVITIIIIRKITSWATSIEPSNQSGGTTTYPGVQKKEWSVRAMENEEMIRELRDGKPVEWPTQSMQAGT